MEDENVDHKQMLSDSLFEAIYEKNIEQVRICINQGADLKFGFDEPVCPLAKACCLGHDEIIHELLKAGADPNQVSGETREPVMHMAARGCVITLTTIKTLIAYGADVNLRDNKGETILHCLTSYRPCFNDTDDNLLSACKLLLDNGARVYARKVHNHTPLRNNFYLGVIKLFIAEGADVNDDTGYGSILFGPALMCDIGMFNLLLNAGADRQLKPDVFMRACPQNDHAMITRVLDTCDVDINMACGPSKDNGMTILHYACINGIVTFKTVQLLLDRGADVRAVSGTGDTVLHYVVGTCDCRKIRQLISYNPPLNTKNDEDQTPLDTLIHHTHKRWHSNPDLHARHSNPDLHARKLAFKMLVAAGAMATADFERELNQLPIKHSAKQISDYEITSTRSLKELCRFVIRGAITVSVDVSTCRLPIPKLLQDYLNFPELEPLVDEYLKIVTNN